MLPFVRFDPSGINLDSDGNMLVVRNFVSCIVSVVIVRVVIFDSIFSSPRDKFNLG